MIIHGRSTQVRLGKKVLKQSCLRCFNEAYAIVDGLASDLEHRSTYVHGH